MYQENELKKLYERLKTQYPQYQLELSGDSLILKRLYCKVEVNRSGVKLYVNGNLYDQFTSEYVDDSDDLYELIEAFLLDLQHAGMKQGNETYIAATKQATKMGSHFLIGTALCLTILMIGLITTNSPWLFLLIFLLPAASLVVLKLIHKRIFQRYWICPACGQPLPMGTGSRFCEMNYVPQCPHCAHVLEQPPELATIQTEYAPQKPLEPPHDLPTPSSKWPCMITGGITTAFALLLLPLIFIPDGNEPLDMAGVWTGIVLLLILLGFGLILLFCRHKEPEETKQPIVIVRERKIIAVLGSIQWCLSLVMMLTAVIVAGIPPFDAALTFVSTLIGLPFMLLGVWMLLAGRNRTLFVFQVLSVKFTTVMKIGALAPIPFLVFCLVFAPVLLFDDRPKNATPEWNAMHIKMPIILVMLIGLLYISQIHFLWGGWILQEADGNWGWLVRVLTIATILTVLLILRTPKRMRLNAGFFMAIIGLFVAVGLHYCVNAALIDPALHYPAVIVDSHANDPDVDGDNYELTIVMNNGKETELVVTEKIYQMAMNGKPLEICHRESPFGVILLNIHAPQTENRK